MRIRQFICYYLLPSRRAKSWDQFVAFCKELKPFIVRAKALGIDNSPRRVIYLAVAGSGRKVKFRESYPNSTTNEMARYAAPKLRSLKEQIPNLLIELWRQEPVHYDMAQLILEFSDLHPAEHGGVWDSAAQRAALRELMEE